ncbi:MAG: ATP-binding protein, partial [bacterium]
EEGKLPVVTEPVNVEKLAEARLLAYEHVATSRNLHLVVRNVEDSAHVMADRRLLDRIIGNLFNHAIANCPNGAGIELVIEPFAGTDRTMVSIHFECNESLPTGIEKRLFSKTAQADMRARGFIKNAGMELTFCRLAVELLGGTMSVEANLVGRVTFGFALPRLVAKKV